MTLLQAGLSTPAEAEILIAAGVDGLIVQSLPGAAPELDALHALNLAAAGRCRVGAMIGDPSRIVDVVGRIVKTGVDQILIGIGESAPAATLIRALEPLQNKVELVAVFFADRAPDLALVPLLARSGFKAAMLATSEKAKGRLLDYIGIVALGQFVEMCRAEGLASGLGGGLESPDIARLLLLAPDFLAFDGALRQAGGRTAALDPDAIELVRDLIPRERPGSLERQKPEPEERKLEDKVDWRFCAAREASCSEASSGQADRVFVHDLVLPVSIGSYANEHAAPQRVRINVDLYIRRHPHRADDMRAVFSYDLIIDAIKLIIGRGHVALVETLGEEIAAAMLQHQRVLGAKIRVEKLDVLNASVGVEIVRERAVDRAEVRRLFSKEMGAFDHERSRQGENL